MSITAFTWKSTEEELATLNALLKYVFVDKPYTIVDLNSFQPKEISGIVLAFGVKSFNILCNSIEPNKVHQLPGCKLLLNVPGNASNRQHAVDTLKSIAELPESTIEVVTDKDLEKFNVAVLAKLKDDCVQKNVSMWKGETSTGKKIALTLNPIQPLTDCDFTFTFEELIAMNYAITILNIKSITLIPGDKK